MMTFAKTLLGGFLGAGAGFLLAWLVVYWMMSSMPRGVGAGEGMGPAIVLFLAFGVSAGGLVGAIGTLTVIWLKRKPQD